MILLSDRQGKGKLATAGIVSVDEINTSFDAEQ